MPSSSPSRPTDPQPTPAGELERFSCERLLCRLTKRACLLRQRAHEPPCSSDCAQGRANALELGDERVYRLTEIEVLQRSLRRIVVDDQDADARRTRIRRSGVRTAAARAKAMAVGDRLVTVGSRFGRIEVLSAERVRGPRRWEVLVHCIDCGEVGDVSPHGLREGVLGGCACRRTEPGAGAFKTDRALQLMGTAVGPWTYVARAVGGGPNERRWAVRCAREGHPAVFGERWLRIYGDESRCVACEGLLGIGEAMTKIAIKDIQIGKRLRLLGDVTELAESIERVGLLQPVTVTEGNLLVFGRHRIEAVKLLGWADIDATVVTLDELDRELAEIDENLIRNELTVLERAEHLARRKELYEARHPDTKQHVAGGKKRHGSASDKMSFADDAARGLGTTPRTVQRDVKIATSLPKPIRDAVRSTPIANSKVDLQALSKVSKTDQKKAVKLIKAGKAKTVREALRTAKKAEARRRIEAEPTLPEGPFRVLVADPPWAYEKRAGDPTQRGQTPYPTMSVEEICKLPVERIAHPEGSMLWLWVTNAHAALGEHARVARAWGFEPKTFLTWLKPRIGLGDILRGQTEHCLVATRGDLLPLRLTNQSTALFDSGGYLEETAREHSRKPGSFLELVESLCPGSKVELFARETREGWVAWGAEVRKFDAAAG